jgi:phosphatidylserine/phosphatidylglycerophosphate/cardiolipin synthase-like enzyme
MFLSSAEYENAVRSVVAEIGELQLAVAFWGRGAELLVHPRPAGPVKLICNLSSGGTNPETISALRQKKNVTLKQNDRLHAKVVIGSISAVIGSANLSSNGLNLEGAELKGWEEAGYVTKDADQLEQIRKWFASMWKDAREIYDQDIEDAKEE